MRGREYSYVHMLHSNIFRDYSHEYKPRVNPELVFINCPLPLDGL